MLSFFVARNVPGLQEKGRRACTVCFSVCCNYCIACLYGYIVIKTCTHLHSVLALVMHFSFTYKAQLDFVCVVLNIVIVFFIHCLLSFNSVVRIDLCLILDEIFLDYCTHHMLCDSCCGIIKILNFGLGTSLRIFDVRGKFLNRFFPWIFSIYVKYGFVI